MNGHAGIDTTEATEHLKNILNVGKSETESVKLKSVSNGRMEASGDSSLVLNDRSYQKVELHASKGSSHISIYGTEVDVYSSPMEHGGTCSQVIVEDMVDYGWKEKHYLGRIISIHISGKYLAYFLKPSPNKPGLVRILRIHLDLRCLIKDYKSEVKDLSFAHTSSQVLLGSVDACGELLVHKIVDDGTTLLCNLLIRIIRPTDWIFSEHNRIIWCMFIPDDNDNEADAVVEDPSTLLVVTHNERAEIWNIQTVINNHGHGDLTIDEVRVGVQVILEHELPITAATFSPDATALAIGSLEGVKFFQVNTLDKDISPRCLHQWTPHPEKMLSSLYFLDSHKNYRPDMQFWKYAVTGAENNTELKIWSCETWACLQTIRLHPNSGDCSNPCFKAEIDLSAKYLFLSDVKRKVLYILLIQQDSLASSVSIQALSEFKVPLPVLSLAIASISYKARSIVGGKESDDEGDVEQIGDVLNDGDEIHGQYVVKLFWIQTKSLQSCRILYNPTIESPLLSVGSMGSLSQEPYIYKDGLSDVSLDTRDSSSRSGKDLDVSLQKGMCVDELSDPSPPNTTSLTALPTHMASFSNCTDVLLTPDDFTSPSHSNLTVQNYQDVANSASKCDSSSNLTDGIDSLPVEPNTLQRRKSSQHSATSSPSREVAEILAPSKVLHLDGMDDQNENLSTKDDAGNLKNSLSSYGISSGPVSSRNKLDIKSEYLVEDWPQAPLATQEYLTTSRNESESASNQIFHSTNGETSTVAFDTNANRALLQMNQNLSTMTQKMESLTNTLREQKCEIQSLQSEMKILQQEQKHSHPAVSLSNKLDQIISQHLVPDYSRLENLIIRTAEQSCQRSEKDITSMTDKIASNFGNRLESTMKYELSTCINPQINKVLETLGQKMQLDFSQKLALTDASLKECVSKNFKGKAFLESVSQSIAASIQSQVQSTCKDIFLSNVIPAFEKACQHLFQQLNETFSKGIQEYMQTVETHSQSSCSALETSTAQLREEINSLVSNAQQTINSQVSRVERHNEELIKHQDTLVSGIRQAVREEVVKAFKEQATSVLNSRSVTPVPQTDLYTLKQRMLQLVQQGSINDAFQQALSAMDVQVVIFLCESVNPDHVFSSTPCPLQQHVLLSLVNQLSADLSSKTDIKVRYLEDVITTLDSNNPMIRDHINGVLETLQQRITNFLQRNPNHKLSRNLKRMSLAIQSLIKT